MNRRRKKSQTEGARHVGHLLNVHVGESMRARGMRRSRMMIHIFQISLVVLAAVVLVVMLKLAFNRAFVESDHFTISRVEVETNGRLERAQVLAATGVREGGNLLKLNLQQIEAGALALPQVETVRVERILPDGLKISLRERVPVAWISCLPAKWRARTATSGLLVDRDGRLFRCESLAPELLGLTIIDLTEGSGLQPGGELPQGPAHAALKLATSLAESNDTTLPRLVQIAVRNGYALEVALENGENAWLSPEEPLADFHRLVDIIEHFRRRDQSLTFANLLPRKNIAIRLAGPDIKPAREKISTKAAKPVAAPAPLAPANRSTPEVRAILNRR